ncbi:MAG: MSMEG_4193 family putative phosphomutase [Actinomycetota bacterium]
MLLLLVRHAVTTVTGMRLTGWLPGFHLSPAGRRQAEAVAERLAAVPVKAVYTSPLERCTETAAAIAARHGLETKVVEGLGEVRYGDWQGRPLRALYRTKAWKELITHPADFRFPGGETIRETQTRAVTTVQSLLERHARQAVVAVSHADVIRLLVAAYLGLGLDLYQRTSIAPASLTAILLGDRIPHVLRVSDAVSVEDLARRLEVPDARPKASATRGRKNGQP